MSEYRDTGQVKARLSGLFKAELGFMKSANLAGEMVTKRRGDCRGDNYDQLALSVLVASAHILVSPFIKRDELLVYLWCHRKFIGRLGSFLPSRPAWMIEGPRGSGFYKRQRILRSEPGKQSF
jgi:hypothetical protein